MHAPTTATEASVTPAQYPVDVAMTLDGDLEQAIRRSWSAETTVDHDWTPQRPSKGQCAVTALVVQDYLGGDLLRALVGEVTHYWNRLPDGTILDLTRDQFRSFEPGNIEPRSREYILSYPATAARYRTLAERVQACRPMEPIGASSEK
jgi:hypothetical protein